MQFHLVTKPLYKHTQLFFFQRREHLTDEDLHKNKAIFESFTKSGNFLLDNAEVIIYFC